MEMRFADLERKKTHRISLCTKSYTAYVHGHTALHLVVGMVTGDRPIGAYYENFRIHSQILAVAAADIEAYRAGRKRLEKAFYDGPRLRARISLVNQMGNCGDCGAHLVAGGREVGGNLLINGMHMLFLVAFAMLILLRWVLG